MCNTQENNLPYNRVAMVRENTWKMKLFPGQGKTGNFVDGQGNLERPWKVREFVNKWMWQADLRKFILFKREKDVLSREIV